MNARMTPFVLIVLVAVSVPAQAADPFAGEFQINTYTPSFQIGPKLAMDALGRFVVVWYSDGSTGTDTSLTSIQARRYDYTGTPLGGELQVNSFSGGQQSGPALAVANAGHFVVAWQSAGSYGTDTSSTSIQAQRYDANGSPSGGEFQVNSYTTGLQQAPAVSADSQGNFVVAWTSAGSYESDTSLQSVQAQRYDAAGAALGGQFQVNSYTTNYQGGAAVAVDANGDFVVVWHSNGSYGSDSNSYSVQAQRYDATGAPAGNQFQINTYTTNRQWQAAVAMDVFGNFVVAWTSAGSYGTDTTFNSNSVQAQRYDLFGQALGGEFQVNTYTTFDQGVVAIAVDRLGDFFVVAWQSMGSYGSDSSLGSIQAQRYDDIGAPVGGEFQVNSYTTGGQFGAAVASDFQGNLIASWSSEGSAGTDTSSTSILGKYYSINAIFGDGFESGDTSSWSSSQ